MVTKITLLYQHIWDKKEWTDAWAHSLIIPIPKKGDQNKYNNYRNISLISYPIKIILRIILNLSTQSNIRIYPSWRSIMFQKEKKYNRIYIKLHNYG